MNSVRSNYSISVKYQRFTLSGYEDIDMRKFDFVAKTQFLWSSSSLSSLRILVGYSIISQNCWLKLIYIYIYIDICLYVNFKCDEMISVFSQVSGVKIKYKREKSCKVWEFYVDTQSIKDYRRCVYCLHYNTMSAWILKKILCMLKHIDPDWYEKNASILKTGSTLKCRSVLAFDFTSQTHLEFFLALDMYILTL